jgi:hypothetical protein
MRLGRRVQPVDRVGRKLTTVSNLNVLVVSTMSLSMVLGTPTYNRQRHSYLPDAHGVDYTRGA